MNSPPEQGSPTLLSIIELGGYPDFAPVYRAAGYEVIAVRSMRKALNLLKETPPAVIVAEFNFQSDFRDRTSSLESLLAAVQRLPDTKVIVLYDREFSHQLAKVQSRFPIFETLAYPIDTDRLASCVHANISGVACS